MTLNDTALLVCDLQNDFAHPEGAYGRAGLGTPEIAALPSRLKPLADRLRAGGGWVVQTQFTLVPGRGGEPLVSPHLRALRPFLRRGDFCPGAWGHQMVEALLWGEALGAATRDLSGHQGHGSVAHPTGILITWATIAEGGVQVNAGGRRFSDEMQGYSEQAAHVLRQPGGVAWTVFDGRIAAVARQFEDFRQAEASGAILTAPDAAALAQAMRAPALKATLREVAALKSAGGSDQFGRSFAGSPPLQPPFCAVRVTGALFHTQGGLAVDGRAAVLGADGRALPNLFAAGGAACGVSGRAASGYLSGNGLLSAVALGHMAGQAAAAVSRPGMAASSG